jgi:polysaccharide biosynthesis protein PslH
MNLLFVAPYVPSLIRVRPFNFVKALARRGHRITLATLVETEEERASLRVIAGWGVDVLERPLSKARKLQNSVLALPSRDPIQAGFSWHPELAGIISQRVRAGVYDAVHVEHLRGSRYALAAHHAALAAARKSPVIWDSVDSITHLFEQSARRSQSLSKRLITQLELGRTRRFEGWLTSQFDQVLVTSRIDRDALLKIATGQTAPVTVVPNGVDFDIFTPGEAQPAAREPDTLVFSGKMSYHANITAVLHLAQAILPAVWTQRPAVKLVVVGKDPSPEVRALAQKHPGRIEVTGSVPDLAAYLRRAAVAVVPIVYGAGVQNKVLEAMATATPVVASATAVSALDPSHVDALMVAQDDASFAAHILRLLSDDALRLHYASAGRAFVERHHNWDAAAQTLEALYQVTPFTAGRLHSQASRFSRPRET